MGEAMHNVIQRVLIVVIIGSISAMIAVGDSLPLQPRAWLPFVSLPSYPPITYYPLSATALEKRYQEFFDRNGASWHVYLDDYGFAQNLWTSDPSFVSQEPSTATRFSAAERDQWIAFIHRNRDFFGITSTQNISFEQALSEPRLRTYQTFGSLKFYESNHIILSEYEQAFELSKISYPIPNYRVQLSITGHFWPNAIVPTTPRLSQSAIAAPFVGTSYTYQEVIYHHRCDPFPGTPFPCPAPPPPTIVVHTVAIQAQDLTITLVPHLVRRTNPERLELRLVYIIELKLPQGWMKARDAITGTLFDHV
jgi:hypothetical protein